MTEPSEPRGQKGLLYPPPHFWLAIINVKYSAPLYTLTFHRACLLGRGEIYALSSKTGIVSSGQNLTSLELTRTLGKDPRWVLIYLITFLFKKGFQ